MTSHIDGLRLRRILGRDEWLPAEPFGPDGFRMTARDQTGSVIATCADLAGEEWVHASIARLDRMPEYDDLKQLHRAVFFRGEGYAYQVFAPPAKHVNIHEHALHLWGRLDGRPVLPEFGMDLPLVGRSI